MHRQKDPSDRNATAVVDPGDSNFEEGPGGQGAREGGGWGDHVDEAAEAYNARPACGGDGGSRGCGDDAGRSFGCTRITRPSSKHNDELTRSRQRRLEEAGAFRAPTNAARSFQPQYGAVREVSSYDSMTVRATDGSETLLKHAPSGAPWIRGAKARLTRRPEPLAIRQLRDFNPGPTAPP